MDESSRRIRDADLADFYKHLLTNLVDGSRVLITSRYRPADVESLPPTAHEEPLSDLPATDFFKLLLHDANIEQRYRADELPHELLVKMHLLFGATPRF